MVTDFTRPRRSAHPADLGATGGRRRRQHGRRPSAPPDPRSAPPVNDIWLNIAMVFAFVLIGGVFSGAEIALVSLRESQVRAMSESGRRGRAVQRLLADPNRFLAAVQVGVTVAGFFSAAFGASTLSAPVADWLEGMGLQPGLAGTLALVLVTIAISYVSLVVGELTPKRLALQRAEGFSLIVASPLNRIEIGRAHV